MFRSPILLGVYFMIVRSSEKKYSHFFGSVNLSSSCLMTCRVLPRPSRRDSRATSNYSGIVKERITQGGTIMASLTNKTALVTGASRGIGRATASVLASAGAHVFVHYGRSVQEAESLGAGIRSKRGRADAINADLGTREGATLLAKEG